MYQITVYGTFLSKKKESKLLPIYKHKPIGPANI